jgi:hypothetical protein
MPVRAKVRYLKAGWKGREERPRIGSRESRRANTAFYEVEIHDARPLHDAGRLDLDTNGFVLARHQSAVTNFRESEQVREIYWGEWEPRLRELSGAAHLIFLHHLIRSETPRDFNDAYARYVHCDFSDTMAEEMTRTQFARALDSAKVDPKQCTFVWYNVWQPIEREVQQNPLTLIDASTLDRSDVVEYTYTASNIEGVASMPVYREDHRFYYFPRMQTDEAIVFKQLDPRPGYAYCTPHTSFDDPTASEDAIGRRSIELRAVGVFPRE